MYCVNVRMLNVFFNMEIGLRKGGNDGMTIADNIFEVDCGRNPPSEIFFG